MLPVAVTTVFDVMNAEYDRIESKKLAKMKRRTVDESSRD